MFYFIRYRQKQNSPKSPIIPLDLSVQQFLENPTRFDAKSGKVRSNTLTVPCALNMGLNPLLYYLQKITENKGNEKLYINPLNRKEFRNPKSTYSPAITKPKPPRPKSPLPSHVIKANPDYKEPYIPVTELPMFSVKSQTNNYLSI
ncbi:hypothetical protein GLOIN_2v1477188 [Rhizophagus irregularis DAOM 181602=DAOM 197198]|nr:hypothetical protein GLOIN_2v1477188 [Rhizophagus irregularis DAOM 181602=DAOM 197198]